MKLFLELQPLMPNIPFAPGIFGKDALQVWVVKAWAEQLSQEQVGHRLCQIVSRDGAGRDTGRHQVHEALHLAVLHEHVSIKVDMLQGRERPQRSNISRAPCACRKFESFESIMCGLQKGRDIMRTPASAVSDVAKVFQVV